MLIHRISEKMPSEGMLAILQQLEESSAVDQTPQYVVLLLAKVALNTLVLSFWLRSITKSLLGLCSISMYLVDLLLVGCISWAWWFRQDLSAHVFLCFALSHSSAIYSFLPLPLLVAGAIDYTVRRHQEAAGQRSEGIGTGQCGAVLMLWVLACSYSYCYTNTEVLMVEYEEGSKALVCPVQASTVVSLFCLNLSFVVCFILLLYYHGLPRWVGQASNISRHWAPGNDLARSGKLEAIEAGPEVAAVEVNQQDRPPLLVSLTLCFALNWAPYILMSVVCDSLGFAVPAYATVNLLWTACANSLLVGVVLWYGDAENTPPYLSPDDICEWSVYWRLSKGDGVTKAIETPNTKVTAPETDVKLMCLDSADVEILEV
ncbi:putative G-protein coupled receptor 160 [Brachyhypopomus gauderio]|uniref:putative G-protein coupled receptor 160 n=1 Tax=Brachyhypopomus gauderio TaxID=698409 RepID=UPI00404236C2